MTSFSSPEEIISFFDDYDLSPSNRDYLSFHALRYFILWKEVLEILNLSSIEDDKILKQVQDDTSGDQDDTTKVGNMSFRGNREILAESGEKISHLVRNDSKTIKLLDIGPGFFTEILGQKLKSTYSNVEIFGLGLKSDYIPFKSKIDFIHFDLNDLYLKPENIPKLEQFDLIICTEVLEHLYTGIDSSLETFSKLLKPNGRLIIQTPNAVSLHHRLKLLFGQNPFSILRPNPIEPGHYREYTLNELEISLKKAGLNPTKVESHNYFNYHGNWKNRIYKLICNLLTKGFKDGITILCSKI